MSTVEEAHDRLVISATTMLENLAMLSRQADQAKDLSTDIVALFSDIMADVGAHIDDETRHKLVAIAKENADFENPGTVKLTTDLTKASKRFEAAAADISIRMRGQTEEDDRDALDSTEDEYQTRMDMVGAVRKIVPAFA